MLSQPEEIQSVFDNPMLSWVFPTDTPTKQIKTELVTIWFVLGSEHQASKLFLGKELGLGVPPYMGVGRIKSKHRSLPPQPQRTAEQDGSVQAKERAKAIVIYRAGRGREN